MALDPEWDGAWGQGVAEFSLKEMHQKFLNPFYILTYAFSSSMVLQYGLPGRVVRS
jgi:hypothetical protein